MQGTFTITDEPGVGSIPSYRVFRHRRDVSSSPFPAVSPVSANPSRWRNVRFTRSRAGSRRSENIEGSNPVARSKFPEGNQRKQTRPLGGVCKATVSSAAYVVDYFAQAASRGSSLGRMPVTFKSRPRGCW
jgi:hypothetical protein